jgi:phosphohistidine phosphatase
MPMLVYLVRHAKAEKDAPAGDAARRLTPEGKAAFEALLESLRRRLRPTRVVTSPYARALETARLLAHATGATLEEDPDLASGRLDGRAILAAARLAGAGAALVGHNPEIAEAIALAAGGERKVRPGTIAAIELGPDEPRLAWLESPP